MKEDQLILGVDFGTSGVRIALLDSNGSTIYTGKTVYRKGLENVDDWKFSFELLVNNLDISLRKRIFGISIDGTSGTLLACDKRGVPLGDALPYFLTCSEQEQKIKELIINDSPASSLSGSLARALRLLEKFGQDILLRHQADWINGWLIDNWQWGEEGNNLRMGWDLLKKEWPKTFSNLSWIDALPDIVPSGKVLKQISKKLSESLGLSSEVLVIAGTTDSNAAVIGAKASREDGITVLGSTIVLKKFVNGPILGPGITNHRLNQSWLCGGASNAGGDVLNSFFNSKDLDELSRQINPKTNSGLKYRPLNCTGERFPVDDPLLKPILEPRPISDSLFLHGLLEGLANIEAEGWHKLASLGVPYPKKIITIGGGAKNPQWRQIRERLIGVPIRTSKTQPAEGVAILALSKLSKKP